MDYRKGIANTSVVKLNKLQLFKLYKIRAYATCLHYSMSPGTQDLDNY